MPIPEFITVKIEQKVDHIFCEMVQEFENCISEYDQITYMEKLKILQSFYHDLMIGLYDKYVLYNQIGYAIIKAIRLYRNYVETIK